MKENNEVLNMNKVLLCFSIANNGDWNGIYKNIKEKKPLTEEEVEYVNSYTEPYFTIVDDIYPTRLKADNMPPFVLFYRGNIEILSDTKAKMVVMNDNLASNYSNETITNICKGVEDRVVFVIKFGNKKDKELIRLLNDRGAELVAVYNRGLDSIDEEDKELFDTLCEKQLVISEYPINVLVKSKKTELNSLKLAVGLSNCALLGGISRKSPYYAGVGFALSSNVMMMSIPFNAGTNYINNKMLQHGVELVENEKDVINLLKML